MFEQFDDIWVGSDLTRSEPSLVGYIDRNPEILQQYPHTLLVTSLAGTHQTAGQARLLIEHTLLPHQSGQQLRHVVADAPHHPHADLLAGQS